MRTQGGLSSARAAQVAPLLVTFLTLPAALAVWAAMPAAETEFLAAITTRRQVDLTGKTNFAIQVHTGVAGQAGAKLRVKYSVDDGLTWTTIESAGGTTGDCNCASGVNIGTSAPLAVAAKVVAQIAVFGVSGNGVVSPTFGLVSVTFT